jgi:hypothetical protein
VDHVFVRSGRARPVQSTLGYLLSLGRGQSSAEEEPPPETVKVRVITISTKSSLVSLVL